MINAHLFLRMQGVTTPDTNNKEILQVKAIDLENLLEDYLSTKLEEMGFKKNDNGRHDTMKLDM